MQFRYAMIPPAPHLAAWINTFYTIETEAERIEEIMPAYSAQISLVVRGRVTLAYADGSIGESSTVTVNAPQLRSAPCVLDGPLTLIGVSLTHVGWQALSNLPADQVHDTIIPAASLFAPDVLAQLESVAAECRSGRLTPADLCAPLGEAIGTAPFVPRADHVAVVNAMTDWLGSGFDPALADLHAAVNVSPRQLQRIARRYFGAPPAQVLKRLRALRAAMLLANPGLSDALREEMLTSYFDQAHLIRDIRRYTGRTPTQLRTQMLSTVTLDPAGHGDTSALLLPEGS